MSRSVYSYPRWGCKDFCKIWHRHNRQAVREALYHMRWDADVLTRHHRYTCKWDAW